MPDKTGCASEKWLMSACIPMAANQTRILMTAVTHRNFHQRYVVLEML
jgi:hypothetical protein